MYVLEDQPQTLGNSRRPQNSQISQAPIYEPVCMWSVQPRSNITPWFNQKGPCCGLVPKIYHALKEITGNQKISWYCSIIAYFAYLVLFSQSQSLSFGVKSMLIEWLIDKLDTIIAISYVGLWDTGTVI